MRANIDWEANSRIGRITSQISISLSICIPIHILVFFLHIRIMTARWWQFQPLDIFACQTFDNGKMRLQFSPATSYLHIDAKKKERKKTPFVYALPMANTSKEVAASKMHAVLMPALCMFYLFWPKLTQTSFHPKPNFLKNSNEFE